MLWSTFDESYRLATQPQECSQRASQHPPVGFKRLPEKYEIQQWLGNGWLKLLRDSQHKRWCGIHLTDKNREVFIRTAERFLICFFVRFFFFFFFFLFLFVFNFSLFQRRGGHGHASHTLLGVCDLWETICTSVDVRIWLGFYELFFSLWWSFQ